MYRTVSYVSHAQQRLLDENAGRPEGPNIGFEGQHLTIAFRLDAEGTAEALQRSIELNASNFKGESLVLHTPDRTQEAERLARGFAGSKLRMRFVPVPWGAEGRHRNLAAEAARTPWLMWLSSSLRFAENIVPGLQRDIAELGCRFMTLRIRGEDDVLGGAWNLVPQFEGHPGVAVERGQGIDGSFLATAVSGEACLFHVERFRTLGGYEEHAPGLEDLDLSLRLFEAGYKVGVSSNRGLERQRAADGASLRPALRDAEPVPPEAVSHFERKFGLHPAGADPADACAAASGLWSEPQAGDRRPKIALIVDVDDWAFANISRQLVRVLSNRFHFEIVPIAALEDMAQVFMLCEGADLIHFFWREVPRVIYADFRTHIDTIGIGFNYYLERFAASQAKTTAVYDHLFLDDLEIPPRAPLFRDWCDGYYVCSQRLFDIYRAIPGYPAPDAVLPDGVDLRVFGPQNLDRFRDMGTRPISVGWVGNSGWASHLGDPKGVHTILKPAIRELAAEGVAIEENFADRVLRMIPHAQMPAYYSSIDVLVCTSEIEGTPNPVLEAMACGVPIVTTDVGVVPEALGAKQQEFILPARSVEALKSALRRLHADRSLFAELSRENLGAIKAWDWPVMAERFAGFFAQAMAKAQARRSGRGAGQQGSPLAPAA